MPETAAWRRSFWYSLRGSLGMPERNTPQKTLESWKQIAGYLDRSERTVRRWEATEGLPVHRREHEKQDTVFAYRHEIEAWSRLRTKCPNRSPPMKPAISPRQTGHKRYLVEHDAITRTMHRYIAGAVQVMVISCARLSILPQPSPVTVREWNIRVPSNTCSNGSRERSGTEHQSSLRPHRDHREYRRRSSGSTALVWQVGGSQCPRF